MPSRYTYGRYTDGPDPLAPPFDLRAALDEMGRDIMEGGSPRSALRELLRRGLPGERGLDDLTRQVWRQRSRLQRQNRLDGTLEEVRRLLERALEAERSTLARDDSDDARFRELTLDALPDSTAGAVRELAEYDWRSSDAREAYQEIQDLLGRELLDQRFDGMKQAMEQRQPRGRRADPRDARRPQRPARRARQGARARRGHPAAVRASSWTSTASSSRRTRATSTS